MSACGDCHGKDCQNTELDEINFMKRNKMRYYSSIFIKEIFACIIFAIHFQWDAKINIFADIAFVGLRNFVSSQKIILCNKVSPRWILVDFGYVVLQKICY